MTTSSEVLAEWLRHLDDDDFRAFTDELSDAHRYAREAGDLAPLENCLRSWQVTAEALADPARREVLTSPVAAEDLAEVGPPGDLLWHGVVSFPDADRDLCRQCDVFIGYGALGVARAPDEHAGDKEWLRTHCWVCERSRDEIRVAGW